MDLLTGLAAPVLLIAFIYGKLVDLAQHARAKDWNAVYTQASVIGAGIAVVFLLSFSDFAGSVKFVDVPIADLNVFSKLILGCAAGNVLMHVYDWRADRLGEPPTPPLFPELDEPK